MAEYLVQDTTMTGIADAVRNLRHETGALTPAQIEAKIGASRLGLPINPTNHLVNNKWVRPSEYPNLDNISLNGFVGVYLTYDLRKTPDFPYIGVYANVNNSSGSYSVQRGHLVDNEFVVDETHSVNSLTSYRDTLDTQNGDVQLWRVIPNNNDTMLGVNFVTNKTGSDSVSGGYQPVVERRGRLPDVNSFGTSLNLTGNSSGYSYQSTFWLEKDYMILPSSKSIGMRYTYRESYSLQDVTLLGDNNGTITLTGNADGMFQHCISLPYVDLSKLRFGEATNINSLFSNAYSIISIDLSDALVANTTYNLASAFTNCMSCRKIKFGKSIKTNSCSYIFNYCICLEDIDIENLGIDGVTSMYCAFTNCRSLKELDLRHWTLENDIITDTRSMLSNVESLTKLLMPSHWPVSSSAANASGVPAYALMLQEFNGMTMYQSHGYTNDYCLTHDSLISILNELPTITTSKTITININKYKLTDAEIEIATNKGWTVA